MKTKKNVALVFEVFRTRNIRANVIQSCHPAWSLLFFTKSVLNRESHLFTWREKLFQAASNDCSHTRTHLKKTRESFLQIKLDGTD